VNLALLGKRVKLGLDKGRARRLAQQQEKAKERAEMILSFAAADVLAGRPSRCRAGRIARKMKGELSESQVRRHLKIILRAFSWMEDSREHNVEKQEALCAPNI